MMKMINVFFRDPEKAERAYNSAAAACYGKDEINIVMSEETLQKYYGDNAEELINKVDQSDLAIAENEIASHVLAINTKVTFPDMTLVVSGPLAAGIAVAAEKKVATDIADALSILEVDKKELPEYKQAIKSGGILIGVRPRSKRDAQRFENDWKNYYA